MPGTSLPPPPTLRDLLTRGPISLFLDFDGTLVELAPTPDGIAVPDHLNRALSALADRLDGRLALVSGRAIADLEAHLGSLGVARAGSHGSDRQRADGAPLGDIPQPLPPDIRREVEQFAAREGFQAEDKPHGAALHCRARPELEDTGLAFARSLAARSGLVVKRGKCVVELVAPGADKGGAVRAFMAEPVFAGSQPFFVGDDVTDEDGFAAVLEYGGAGILVGDRDDSRAQFSLPGPAGVHAWLEL